MILIKIAHETTEVAAMTDSTIHTAAWLINPDVPPVAGGAILVKDGIVAATGTLAELKGNIRHR